MALLYPWATREYLLWDMSLAQIILYHNLGIEQKYPRPKDAGPRTVKDMSYEEVKKIRDQLRKDYGEIGGDNG